MRINGIKVLKEFFIFIFLFLHSQELLTGILLDPEFIAHNKLRKLNINFSRFGFVLALHKYYTIKILHCNSKCEDIIMQMSPL